MMIQTIFLDVDGTLTNGSLIYGNGIELKSFNVKDGLILKALPFIGISVILLTGRQSEAVTFRASELNAIAMQNIEDKVTQVHKIVSGRGISVDQTAYIGDDLNDYGAMKLCKWKACPADASVEVKAIVDYVSPYNGGYGAVRNCIEILLHEINKYDLFLSCFYK